MDWNNIISFVAGGLIAIIPVIISNRYQAKEKDKDRLEQRREAKIQAREKWIERDILKIMDLLEELIKLTSEYEIFDDSLEALQIDKEVGLFTKDELDLKMKSNYGMVQSLFNQTIRTRTAISRLVLSFDEPEIVSGYRELVKSIGNSLNQGSEYFEGIAKGESVAKNQSISWDSVRENAGKFQQALRNKLISLRE